MRGVGQAVGQLFRQRQRSPALPLRSQPGVERQQRVTLCRQTVAGRVRLRRLKVQQDLSRLDAVAVADQDVLHDPALQMGDRLAVGFHGKLALGDHGAAQWRLRAPGAESCRRDRQRADAEQNDGADGRRRQIGYASG